MSTNSKLFGGITLGVGGKVAGRSLVAITQVLVARSLGPAAYGLFSIGWAFMRVSQSIASLGLNNAVVRFGSTTAPDDGRRVNSVIARCLAGAAVIAAAFGLSTYVLRAPLARQLFGKSELVSVLAWVSLAVVLVTVLRLVASATLVRGTVKYLVAIEDILQPLLFLAFAAVLLFIGFRVTAALLALNLSLAVALAVGIVCLGIIFPGLGPGSLKGGPSYGRLLAYGLPTALAGLCAVLLVNVTRLILGAFRPAEETGLYSAAMQCATLLTLATQGFNGICQPMIARLHQARDASGLGALCRTVTRWSLYVAIPMTITLTCAAKDLLAGLFGSRYGIAASALVVLAAAEALRLASAYLPAVLLMTGRQRLWMVLSVLSLVAVFAGGLVLVPRFGLIGAALASALGVGALQLAGVGYVMVKMKLVPFDGGTLKLLIAGVVCLGLALLTNHRLTFSPLVQALVLATVVHLSFCLQLLVLGIDAEDANLLRGLVRRLR